MRKLLWTVATMFVMIMLVGCGKSNTVTKEQVNDSRLKDAVLIERSEGSYYAINEVVPEGKGYALDDGWSLVNYSNYENADLFFATVGENDVVEVMAGDTLCTAGDCVVLTLYKLDNPERTSESIDYNGKTLEIQCNRYFVSRGEEADWQFIGAGEKNPDGFTTFDLSGITPGYYGVESTKRCGIIKIK